MKRYFFAPGALDKFEPTEFVEPARQDVKHVDTLGFFILVLCLVAAGAALVGMALGYIEFTAYNGAAR